MIMFTTMGHLRPVYVSGWVGYITCVLYIPNLSPARPKNAAPTERRSRVNVMAVVMLVLDCL
jgi:hypothetical protein